MKYDQDVDVLSIGFSSAVVEESDEETPGIIFDYDKNENRGHRILNASKRIENPRALEYGMP